MGHSFWGDCPDFGNMMMGQMGTVKHFEEALAEDFRNTVIVALLVAFLGLGGFVSLCWPQNYRFSRRTLSRLHPICSRAQVA